MASVVRHFGDFADGEKPCGICDYCAPSKCDAQRFRAATPAEHAALLRVAAELRAGGSKSTGKLYAELFPHHEMSRDDFENLLGGMARVGIVRLDDAVFEKAGRQIPYRTARLTRAGMEVDAQTPVDLVMKDQEPPVPRRKRGTGILPVGSHGQDGHATRRRKKVGASSAGPGPNALPPDMSATGTAPPPGLGKKAQRPPDAKPDYQVEEALRAWRLAEARRLGVPAFRIFTDRALSGLVDLRPSTTSEMLAVPGIGLRIAEKYGHEIRRILHGSIG
jgi:DNA topoisomerase-3